MTVKELRDQLLMPFVMKDISSVGSAVNNFQLG